MKSIKTIFRCVAACAAVFATTAFVACGGTEPPKPEGDLVLSASNPTPETGEEITFTVMQGEQDVTAGAIITNMTTDQEVVGAKFSSDVRGIFKFKAEYNGKPMRTINVTVTGPEPVAYSDRILLAEFTYVTCTWCGYTDVEVWQPLADEYKDRFVTFGLHISGRLFSGSSGIAPLMSTYRVQGAPTWFYDLDQQTFMAGPGPNTDEINEGGLINAATKRRDTYPTTCAIKASSQIEGSKAVVDVDVKFMMPGNYKIACALVEDCEGRTGEVSDSFPNTLRKGATDLSGATITPAIDATTEDDERSFHYEVDLDPSWDRTKCSFIIYVLKEKGTNQGYAANSVIELALGDWMEDYPLAQEY